MKKILWLCVALILVASAYAVAAETFTITAGDRGTEDFSVTRVYWKAAADGTKVVGNTIPDGYVNGRVISIITNPGAEAPADNYDLTILDRDGVDIAGGALADRDTTTSEIAQPHYNASTVLFNYGRPVVGPLTVTFTNQANANCDGEIVIFSAK